MEISNHIASLSMAASNVQTYQSANISTFKKAMDTQKVQAEAITDMLPSPSFGHKLDIRV